MAAASVARPQSQSGAALLLLVATTLAPASGLVAAPFARPAVPAVWAARTALAPAPQQPQRGADLYVRTPRSRCRPLSMASPNAVAIAKSVVNLGVLGMLAALVVSPVGIACFLLDCFGGFLKLAWRLAVLGMVMRLIGPFLMKRAGGLAMKVMLSGGPINAIKAAFFGSFANLFGGLASLLAGKGPLDGIASFFGKCARGCDERMPSAGLGGMFDPSNLASAGSGGGGGGGGLFGGGGSGGSGEDPFKSLFGEGGCALPANCPYD